MSNPINPHRAAILAAEAANAFREAVLNGLNPNTFNSAWNKYHDAVVTMCAAVNVTDEDAIAVIMSALTAAIARTDRCRGQAGGA